MAFQCNITVRPHYGEFENVHEWHPRRPLTTPRARLAIEIHDSIKSIRRLFADLAPHGIDRITGNTLSVVLVVLGPGFANTLIVPLNRKPV
jgi:hypothetical protein